MDLSGNACPPGCGPLRLASLPSEVLSSVVAPAPGGLITEASLGVRLLV